MSKENILQTYLNSTYYKTVDKLQSAQKECDNIILGGQTIPQGYQYKKLLDKYKKP